jgi:hypothetical protein
MAGIMSQIAAAPIPFGAGDIDPYAGAPAFDPAAYYTVDPDHTGTLAAAASPLADRMREYGEALMGAPSDIKGALAQQRAARNQAAAAQIAAINRAAQNIRAASQGSVNLPMLIGASALMAPTRTGSFGESLSNAGMSVADALQKQRALDVQNATAGGNLDIAASQVPRDISDLDAAEFYKRMGTGQAMEQSAALGDYRSVLANAAVQRAQAATARADPAKVREAQALVANGVAPDFGTAYAMVRSGVKDPAKFSQLVTAKMHAISSTLAGMNMTPDQVEQEAQEQVVAEMAGAQGQSPATPPTKGGGAAAAAKPPPKAQADALLAQAKYALAHGADRAATIARLKQMGVDPKGL